MKRLILSRAAAPPEIRQRILALAAGGEAVLEDQTRLALTGSGAGPMIAGTAARVQFLSISADPAEPPNHAASAATLGGHHFDLIEGAGHCLPPKVPVACTRHVRDFLDMGRASPC